jgi:glucose/arabinose dehydrogenase
MKKITSFLILLLVSSSVYSQVNFVNAFLNLSFNQPLFLTHSGDNTNRIFIVQQNGFIRVFPNDSNATSYTTFLDVTNKILTGSERGLLGLAFHPNYSSNRYFYIYYTRSGDGALIISRFTTQIGNPNKADSLSELNILTVPHPTYSNHNGGNLMFGQDGYLYTGMGDGGSGGDPGNNAQNVNAMLGKIHRIDINNPSGGNNYGIPPTNPFAGGGGLPTIYDWGMRNPWRFSQDLVTGIIYCGDVGQDAWEEVDILQVGKNYGWRCYEGNHPFNLSGCGPITDFTFPIKEYHNGPPEAECSITGGYVYRGARVPWLVGRYVYGDYCSRRVWKLLYTGGNVSDTSFIGTAPSAITSFGVDQSNELYLTCANGIIYKLLNAAIGITGNNSNVENYSLFQNYPNPFNPVTKIKFDISPVNMHEPNSQLVKLILYDALGRQVQVLVNEFKLPGSYEVEWDGSNYPSGLYMYKLSVGDYTSQKKMVLLK